MTRREQGLLNPAVSLVGEKLNVFTLGFSKDSWPQNSPRWELGSSWAG